MRVTVSHNKTVEQVKQRVDQGFDQLFTGLPIAAVQIVNQKREWNGQQMNFSFTAQSGFINVPLKGFVLVEDRQVTVDLDLPPFLEQFIPESKVKGAVETQVKGLLT